VSTPITNVRLQLLADGFADHESADEAKTVARELLAARVLIAEVREFANYNYVSNSVHDALNTYERDVK
jgi:hypothetical protein